MFVFPSATLLIHQGFVWVDPGVPCPVGFDGDATLFAGLPMVKAAPGPVFWLFNESTLYRVSMDVAELLGELGASEDVEVVVVELPETRAVAL